MLRFWVRHRRRHQAPAAAVCRPLVEQLEDRRLLNAGSLDPFFGFLGKSVTPLLNSGYDAAHATAFQADGKLIVAGSSDYGSGGQGSFALSRYNANGTLDWGFGLGGRTTAYFALPGAGRSVAQVNAVAVQPDGKILAVGSVSSFGNDFALARFNPNGTLDTTFGNGTGEVITYIPNSAADEGGSATSVALLSNGKFVVGGQAGFGAFSFFALAQYNSDGSLDTTFGSGTGEVTTRIGFATQGSNAMTVDANGNIVLAGFVQAVGGRGEFAVARITAAGTPDTTFGGTGMVATPFSGSEYAYAVTTLPGGKIRVAGDSAGNGPGQTVALAQYNANGSLDTTFGTGGTVTAPFAGVFPGANGNVQASDVSFTPDGKVFVVGATSAAASDFAVARYNANGTPDTTFGSGGTVTTDFGGTDVATAVAIKADGTLAVAGDTSSNNGDFAVARYRSNGSPLTSFGRRGTATTDFFFSTVAPTSPAFQPSSSGFTVALPNGDLLVAGTIVPDGLHGEFVVARYTSFGLLDPTFGNLGTVVTSFGAGSSASVAGLAVGPNGTIVLVGSVIVPGTTTGGDIAVAAYNADGSPDTVFNGTGTLTVDFNGMNDTGAGVAVQPNGQIVVVGTTTDLNSGDLDFALARINPNGTLDPTFGTGGEVTTDFGSFFTFTGTAATGVALLSNGQILVGGTVLNQVSLSYDNMAVARYGTDGTLDTTFNSAGPFPGLATADFGAESACSSLAVAPNGQIVLGGTTTDPNTGFNDFAVARFNGDGSTDTTFGGGTGEVSFSFDGGYDNGASVVVQGNGKILIAGTATNATTFKSDFALARLNVDGSLDSTFGTGGMVTTDLGGTDAAASVVLTPSGNIVVGGMTYGNGGGDLALVCYLGDSGHWWNW